MSISKINYYNPDILKWARERCGRIETKRFAELKPKITEWEAKENYPTYNQLEELADIYNLPIAVFFYPEPPYIEMERPDFRTSGNLTFSKLSNKFIRIIDRASIMQMNLEELFNYSGEKPKKLLNTLSSLNYKNILEELRKTLSVSLEEQIKLTPDKLLTKIRSKLFKNGIFVFKEPFYNCSISGFCIYDNDYPVIFLNSALSQSQQLFSLIHELYHLIQKTNSIEEINYFNEKDEIEKLCDQFALDFLLPEEECLEIVKDTNITDKLINDLAKHFTVSSETILIRLISLGIIDWTWYDSYIERFKNNSSVKPKNSDENSCNSKISSLGQDYINLVYEAYDSSQIDDLRLCEYLGLKMNELEQFEKYLN